VTLAKRRWTIPDEYGFGPSTVVPMWAGQEIGWQVVDA
jgi:dihydroorotase